MPKQPLVCQARVLQSHSAICPRQETDGQLNNEMTEVGALDVEMTEVGASDVEEQLIEDKFDKFRTECRQERLDVCLPFFCFGLEVQ